MILRHSASTGCKVRSCSLPHLRATPSTNQQRTKRASRVSLLTGRTMLTTRPFSQAQTFLHTSRASSSNITSGSRTRRILTPLRQTQQRLLLRRCAVQKGVPERSHPPWTSQTLMSMFNASGLQSKASISTQPSAALDTQQEWRTNRQTCMKSGYCLSINLHRIRPEMSK